MEKKILDLVTVIFFVLFVLFGSIESENMIPLFITTLAWMGFVACTNLLNRKEELND